MKIKVLWLVGRSKLWLVIRLLIQHQKQSSPNEVTDEGMVIEVKPLQPSKQKSPNEVTDEGMVIEVKHQQLEKQDLPNEVTDEGMVIEVKPLQ